MAAANVLVVFDATSKQPLRTVILETDGQLTGHSLVSAYLNERSMLVPAATYRAFGAGDLQTYLIQHT